MSEDQLIAYVDFRKQAPEEEYYRCTFEHCDFSGLLLSGTDFEECIFKECNFTMAKFTELIQHTSFWGCKMVGADFTEMSKVSNALSFEDCRLDYAVFVGVKLRKTWLKGCSLQEAYLDRSDWVGSVFEDCDLARCSFSGANLERCDFTSAFGFVIRPEECKLKKARFTTFGLSGLVAHLGIEVV